MPQVYTTQLNTTIQGVDQNRADVPPDSLSVRLKLDTGQGVDIFGIHWGVRSAVSGALTALDFGVLKILKDAVFDPNRDYDVINSALNLEDEQCVHLDVITTSILWAARDYATPIKLRGATNWLIVFPPPADVGTPAQNYDTALTVRGEIVRDDGMRL